jgi:PAS domain S-box-containing protein
MNNDQTDSALLRSIFDSSVEGILVVDDQGTILEANISCVRMFGYKDDELKGMPLENLLPEKFRKKHIMYREAYIKNPQARPMGEGLELWGLKKDASEFPLDISLSPSKVRGQNVTIAFVKDATKRHEDLSQLKRSNILLRETNRKYSTLISNLRGIVYRCDNDRDWTMTYISDGCKKITGYDAKDFLEGTLHFSSLILKEDQQKVWDDTQRALKEKKPYSFHFRIRDKAGQIKHLQELGKGVFDENGQLEALEGFITDITEQKRVEEDLLLKEAKNKALLEAIPDMMVIQDYKGKYLDFYAPEPDKEFLPKTDVIGKLMKDVLPSELTDVLEKVHQKVMESGTVQLVEYGLFLNNERKIFEGRVVPLNQHALLTIVRDITEKKNIEQKLRESEIRMRAILKAIPDQILILNKEGEYLNFYETNNIQTLSESKEKVAGKNIKELFPKEISNRIRRAIAEVIEQQETRIVEYALEHLDGLRFYETRLVYMTSDQVLAIVRDITVRRRAEQERSEIEAKTKGILQALPDIIIVNDKKGRIIEMQTPAPNLLLAPVEDLLGKYLHEMVPENRSKEIQEAFNRANRKKTIEYLETNLPTENKSVDFEVRIVPLENDKSLSILRDVTKTKQVQDRLYIRNRALEAAGNGIVIVDARQADLPIVFTNNSFLRMTGYDREEVMGVNCRFLQNDDRDQESIGTMAKAIQKREACQVELRNYKKDGTLFWNELTITPVSNEQGELTHFIGVQNDITERKNEELLKEDIRTILEYIANEYPLEMIANIVVEAIQRHIKGCMASIRLFNKEEGILYKLTAPNLPPEFVQALEGEKIEDKASPGCTAAYLMKEVVVDDIASDSRHTHYGELALKYGLKSCWSFPIFSSKKEVLGTFSIYCDHERKPQKREREIVANVIDLISVAIEQHNNNVELAESKVKLEEYTKHLEEKVDERTEELKATVKKLVETNLKLQDQVQETRAAEGRALASQEMFATISKNFPKGVIIVYNAAFEIVYVDGGEIRRNGFERDNFVGKPIDEVTLFSKERIRRIKQDIKKTMAGENLSFEIKFNNKYYAVNSSPMTLLEDGDEIKWSLFVYNDITKQKQAETDIRNALIREQELNELKSRFVSMASHEFRTPLSAISTSAILINKQNDAGNTGKIKKYAEQIQQNVRNLVVILNDFLSLGKLEEGKVRARPEYFDLVGYAKNLINEFEPNLKKGQDISLNTDPEVIETYLDPKLMHHILTNLVSNAIKYSQEDQQIEINLKKKENSILLLVKDEGIGIAKEEHANLFQRFFRAENSTNIQGTGLGLHIVKQYTELMGGEVGFESEKDQGSTFWVEFPVRDVAG